MPAFPAVMKEDMSQTLTPMRSLPPLELLEPPAFLLGSPAPHAAVARRVAPAAVRARARKVWLRMETPFECQAVHWVGPEMVQRRGEASDPAFGGPDVDGDGG